MGQAGAPRRIRAGRPWSRWPALAPVAGQAAGRQRGSLAVWSRLLLHGALSRCSFTVLFHGALSRGRSHDLRDSRGQLPDGGDLEGIGAVRAVIARTRVHRVPLPARLRVEPVETARPVV